MLRTNILISDINRITMEQPLTIKAYWKEDGPIFKKKCIVFHGYYKPTDAAVFKNSPIFPNFPSMLVPLSQIRNHINHNN